MILKQLRDVNKIEDKVLSMYDGEMSWRGVVDTISYV